MKTLKKLDTVYVSVSKKKVYRTIEIGDILIDYDKNGKVIGIEFINPLELTYE